MRIGQDKDYENKEAELLNWSSYYGTGISGIYSPDELPADLFNFCVSQFQRFNVPVPPQDVITRGVWATFITIDYFDPYQFFYGDTDVVYTDDWRSKAYKIDNEDLEPDFLETFELVPGQDVKMFEYYMNNPGLQRIDCSHTIEEHIDGELAYDHVQISDLSYEWLKAHSPPAVDLPPVPKRLEDGYDWVSRYGLYKKGEPDTWLPMMEDILKDDKCKAFLELALEYRKAVEVRLDYIRLAAWAAYVWFMGPLGRDFRRRHYDIFELCYREKSCVLYSGTFYGPSSYTVENRAPHSCEICGLDSYCVSLAHFNGGAKFICEHHLNGELPKFTNSSCGSRVCRFTECKFHPMFGIKDARRLAHRESGQLVQKVKENQQLIGQAEQPKLIN